MPTDQADRQLVSRARAGDVDAFEELVRGHAVMAYRVAFRVVGNTEDAQDVSQRALLSAWQGLGAFRGDASFASWLYQIVRRHALNTAMRSPRTTPVDAEPEQADQGSGPAQLALEHDAALCLHAAVAELPAGQGSVVRLYHFENLSYAQIAAETHCTEAAVRSQLFRARRSLAVTLAAHR